MRIAVGGISHETNTFTSAHTRLEDFKILKGKDLFLQAARGSYPDRGVDLFRNGPLNSLLVEGVDIVPTIYASALPSGLVEKDTYLHVKENLLRQIEVAGRVDGVCLLLHGAMVVEDIGGGEIDLIKSVRETVGRNALISVSLDLHGNISPEILQFADIPTAYRTAPHTDSAQTRERALSLLVHCIKNKTKPVSVIVKPPLLLPGEMVVTDVEPALGLFRKLWENEQCSRILSSSLLVGFAWADVPYAGASVIVVAGNEAYLNEAYMKARELAGDYWIKRREFRLEVTSGSVDETIKIAKAYPVKPVFISDSGDNVTAGAAGDIPLFVERLLSLNARDVVVAGIVDPDAVALCREAGIRNSLKVEIGGKLDRVNGYPLEVKGKVKSLSSDGAVLEVSGINIILTTQRHAFTTLESFKYYGINPIEYKIVVVKLGYLFPDLRKVVALALMALSPGFSNLLLDQLSYKNVTRPIFPLDNDFTWAPSYSR